MKVNVGCGTHYAEGWINTDVVRTDTTRPDVIQQRGQPLPFENESVDAVYLGHLVEHIPYLEVVPFLEDVRRVLRVGGELLIVGPDVYRTLRLWRDGEEPWELVISVLEHLPAPAILLKWPEAPHWWNCEESRVTTLLEAANFRQIASAGESSLRGWPVVGYSQWQFAVHAVR